MNFTALPYLSWGGRYIHIKTHNFDPLRISFEIIPIMRQQPLYTINLHHSDNIGIVYLFSPDRVFTHNPLQSQDSFAAFVKKPKYFNKVSMKMVSASIVVVDLLSTECRILGPSFQTDRLQVQKSFIFFPYPIIFRNSGFISDDQDFMQTGF